MVDPSVGIWGVEPDRTKLDTYPRQDTQEEQVPKNVIYSTKTLNQCINVHVH